MNNEKLFQELKELNLLWSGLSRIPNFPKELLELSLNKLENINSLLEDLIELSPQSQKEVVPHTKEIPEVEEFFQKKETAPDIESASASSLSAPAAGQAEKFVSPSERRIPKQPSSKPESLVDRYEKNSSKASLQKKLESKHFADLSKALSLNDRFRFRRDLFGNSPDIMNKALQEINAMQSKEEALAYLNKNYSSYIETESFTDFCNLLDNHFTS
ncbi:MAG: hypothetical protein PHF38_04460 [Bacteroidales bacterium]|jgi:hypothetical protein|nr:hypothetical protein [Bacteroidales bacterium]MDD4362306.1 hypothetical protein [Bacteroidales bacterium]